MITLITPYIIPVVFLTVLFLLFAWAYHIEKKRSSERHEMEELPEQSEVKAMDFNGHTLYLPECDVPAWNALSNAQKREVHLRQKALIKSGHLIKVTDSEGREGLITRAEALRTGDLVQYTLNGITNVVSKEEFERVKKS